MDETKVRDGRLFLRMLRQDLAAHKDKLQRGIEYCQREAERAVAHMKQYGTVVYSAGVFQRSGVEVDQECRLVDKLQSLLNSAERLLPVEILSDEEHDAVVCEACGISVVLDKATHHHEGGEHAQCVHLCRDCEVHRMRVREEAKLNAKKEAERLYARRSRKLQTLREKARLTGDHRYEAEAKCLEILMEREADAAEQGKTVQA